MILDRWELNGRRLCMWPEIIFRDITLHHSKLSAVTATPWYEQSRMMLLTVSEPNSESGLWLWSWANATAAVAAAGYASEKLRGAAGEEA